MNDSDRDDEKIQDEFCVPSTPVRSQLQKMNSEAPSSDEDSSSIESAKFMKTQKSVGKELPPSFTQEYINRPPSSEDNTSNEYSHITKHEKKEEFSEDYCSDSDAELTAADRRYFCRCFSLVIQEVKSTKTETSKLLESFQKKLDRSNNSHTNEVKNYLERVAVAKTDLALEQSNYNNSLKEIRSLKSFHTAQTKEGRAKNKEKETGLELQIEQLKHRIK